MSRALHSAFVLLTLPPLAFALLTTLACSGTETGNPPLAPTLDPSQLYVGTEVVPTPGDPHDTVIEGTPGAVSPSRGHILAWNLETQDPESIAEIRDDGSFVISLPAFVTQHIRLQAVDEDEYSEPTTIELGVATGTPRAVSSCLSSIAHAVRIPGEGAGLVELHNNCGELRNARASIRSSGNAIPLDVMARFVRIEVSAAELGALDRDLLIVEAERMDGMRVRQAVTLVR